MRVCQFRHDGNLDCNAAAALRPPCQEESTTLFYSHGRDCQTSFHCRGWRRIFFAVLLVRFSLCLRVSVVKSPPAVLPRYPSFAVMEILAFSTFDTGQPFSAASAYF